MNIKEFIDILDELIAVDTDEGLIIDTLVKNNQITVRLKNNTVFTVTIEQKQAALIN